MDAVTKETYRGEGRVYENHLTGERFPSVTTILGVLDKPGLPRWAAREVAKCVVEGGGMRMIESAQSAEEAIKTLARQPWEERNRTAEIGTAVHEAMEAWALQAPHEFTLPYSAEAAQARQNAMAILEHAKPEPIHVEVCVWNRSVGYAGTLDGIFRVGEETWLIDWKTSSGAYPETGLQLAAYRYGECIIDMATGEETPIPPIDRCAIFHAPRSSADWGIYHCTSGLEEFEVFRSALAVRRWKLRERETMEAWYKG